MTTQTLKDEITTEIADLKAKMEAIPARIKVLEQHLVDHADNLEQDAEGWRAAIKAKADAAIAKVETVLSSIAAKL